MNRPRIPCRKRRGDGVIDTVISSGVSRPRMPSIMPRTKARWPRMACLVLSSVKNAIRPSPPENVAMSIEHFIVASERPVVLLDGFEYLVSHNDFGSVLALLHDLNESVAIHESILLVPFDPSAFNDREIALIRREVRLIGPMAEEFGHVARIST